MLANSQNTDLTGTLERGYLQYEAGSLRLRLGRQAVSWGAGWFFRPSDLITPRSPLSAEATRPGAGSLDRDLGDLSRHRRGRRRGRGFGAAPGSAGKSVGPGFGYWPWPNRAT